MKFWHITFIVSIFLTVFTNNTLWTNVISRLSDTTSIVSEPDFFSANALFLVSFFVVLIFITNTLNNRNSTVIVMSFTALWGHWA